MKTKKKTSTSKSSRPTIHVSQGHEKSISLEVFLKSFACLTQQQRRQVVLHASLPGLTYQAEKLKFNHLLKELCVQSFDPNTQSQTLSSLRSAMTVLKQGDVLLTLPTSKDQFDSGISGHTDFFRQYYKSPNLIMFFLSPEGPMALLSDHIPLSQVPLLIGNKKSLFERLLALSQYAKLLPDFDHHIFVSGLNPHAGEDGRLGMEEFILKEVLLQIQKSDPSITWHGPIPGDALLLGKRKPRSLYLFLYHDQGLGQFKDRYGKWGINLTLGLPFQRISPDHGTAFDLYLKNDADYSSCFYCLKFALSQI